MQISIHHIKRVSLLLCILVFINILFGPLVRATNSGLACPDWPLCFGRVLPPAEFRIWMEVGHRFYSGGIALVLLYLGFYVMKSSELRKNFALEIVFASTVIFIQIILGALTVTKLLDPTTVNLHLLNAVLFLLTVVTIYLKSRTLLKEENFSFRITSLFTSNGILGLFIFLLVYYQLYMGGRVSSNYAGLVCPDWPLCQGSWVPKPFIGPIRYHVEHRFMAYFLLVLVLGKFVWAYLKGNDKKEKILVTALLFFCGLQIFLGIINVLWRIPTLLTAVHTANGVAFLLASYVVLHYSLMKTSIIE